MAKLGEWIRHWAHSASENGATTDDSIEGDELIEIVCAEAHCLSAVARTAHVDLQPGLLQERAFLEHFAFFLGVPARHADNAKHHQFFTHQKKKTK